MAAALIAALRGGREIEEMTKAGKEYAARFDKTPHGFRHQGNLCVGNRFIPKEQKQDLTILMFFVNKVTVKMCTFARLCGDSIALSCDADSATCVFRTLDIIVIQQNEHQLQRDFKKGCSANAAFRRSRERCPVQRKRGL